MPDDLPNPAALMPLDEETILGEDHSEELTPEEMKPALMAAEALGVCLSYSGFYAAFATILVALAFSSLSAALLYVKLQRVRYEKGQDLPRCS